MERLEVREAMNYTICSRKIVMQRMALQPCVYTRVYVCVCACTHLGGENWGEVCRVAAL